MTQGDSRKRAGFSGNTQPSNVDQGGVQMTFCLAAAPFLGSECLRQGMWSTVYSAGPQSYSWKLHPPGP